MQNSVTPVVIGPTVSSHNNEPGKPTFYIVDDHHTLCALDYSGFDHIVITLHVLCDKREFEWNKFWTSLNEQGLSYLGAAADGQAFSLPTRINVDNMPKSFSFMEGDISLPDDPWRSLAGFSRKVTHAPPPAPLCSDDDSHKLCERCMMRGCGVHGLDNSGPSVYFFEFRWGYFFLDVTTDDLQRVKNDQDPIYWPSKQSMNDFVDSFKPLVGVPVDKVDVDDWKNAARYIVPLCRSEQDRVVNYNKLPLISDGGLFPNTFLPGAVHGYGKLSKDPNCDPPSCR
jgi:hypothetical protein